MIRLTRDMGKQLRRGAQRRPPARSKRTLNVGPLVLAALVPASAIVLGVVLGLPTIAVVAVVIGTALLAGLAARRTLASLVAGAGIRVAQPYESGEQVRVFVPELESVQDAEIVRVGPANTTLLTASGIVQVPNAQMLRGPSRLS